MGCKEELNNIMALIPARAGSKGVPGKNIRLLEGYPLIAYSIVAATMSQKIGRVVVSTDSEEIASVARSFGAEVPFIRPKRYATDKSPDIEFVLHALNWFSEHGDCVPEYLVHLRPTTPLRDPNIIDEAIEKICRRTEALSLRSGHPVSESPFKWFLKGKNEYFKSLLSSLSSEDINKPRQSFAQVYIPDGYVDVIKSSFVLGSASLHGDKMIGFVSPLCTEVDSVEEFEYLEYLLKTRTNPLYEYLKDNFPAKE